MKNKNLIPILISGSFLITTNVVANEIPVTHEKTSIEVGLEVWNQNSTGTFQNNGTVVDFDKRGFNGAIKPSIYLNIKTARKRPNLKLKYTKINSSKSGPLGSNLTLNGLNYFTNQDLKLEYKADVFDFILEHDTIKRKEIFNNSTVIDLDLGVGARYIDGEFSISQCSQNTKIDFQQWVPTIYARSEINEKGDDTKLIAQIIYSPSSTQHLDAKVGVSQNFSKNVKGEFGYRLSQTKIADSYNVDAETKGVYLGLSRKF